ncbi:hypothetical protein ACIQI8_27580 [Streptomyces sp. NPDC092369]|uniref:hypothetical protein n=1 Tax=Streptomyces sp. NPDC092369 TaxID=3366015 RepID=UPI0037FBE2D7
MPRHALPSGNWVELRDPDTLRRGDKKKALGLVPIDEDIELTLATEMQMTDGVLVVMISSWSFEFPVSPESIALMSLADGSVLEDLPEIKAAHKLLFPQQPEATPEQAADPASPTEPSDG